jgi:hypothetical protein
MFAMPGCDGGITPRNETIASAALSAIRAKPLDGAVDV